MLMFVAVSMKTLLVMLSCAFTLAETLVHGAIRLVSLHIYYTIVGF